MTLILAKDLPKDDPGLLKFKAGMKKRHCLMCGRNFSYDLGIHYNEGYICQPATQDKDQRRSPSQIRKRLL